MKSFIEKMLFAPSWYHYSLIIVLSPLSLLYGFSMYLRRFFASEKDFSIPIVSVGNLMVGGSGKTPFTIGLAGRYGGVTVISRGYGRKSKGLVEVSREGEVLVDVEKSGDEPMLMALSLPKASVIVSEDRHKAIELAKSRGARLIILDDGFNRVDIKKFDIVLEPERIKNYLPFPSGAFREFWFSKKYADVVAKEGRDFQREVSFENLTSKMLLVTAISQPTRLDKYLPKGVVKKVYLQDHEYFDESKIQKLFEVCGAMSILCTSKDKVKMLDFALPISEMKLKLKIDNAIIKQIETYIEGYNSER
jgi:tetraacyldisaccharide 4'-kinase